MSDYKYNKEWRRKNPEKWSEMKKRNYDKTRGGKNSGDVWTLADMLAIFERKMSDTELAKVLGRSVQSIQVRRCVLNKKEDK